MSPIESDAHAIVMVEKAQQNQQSGFLTGPLAGFAAPMAEFMSEFKWIGPVDTIEWE
jgi:hypothetical protein